MDKVVDIKDISGTLLLTPSIEEGSKRKFLLMKEDYITLKFSLEDPVHFKLGDYVDDARFGLFEVCDLQKPAYNTSTGGYDYDLRLDAYYWKWKNKIFKYTPEAAGREASWNLTAPLDAQAGVVLRNLKTLGYTYKGQDFDFSIDSSVENKSLPMSYDNINILDACFEMAKKWDCECWVTENFIHFGRLEHSDPVDFEIGVNVEDMTRSESQSAYATRIYAFGSTRNIPANYRPVDESVVVNGVVQRRLMLPVGTPYIDAYPNMRTEEAVEQVVIFDDIYPRRVGTMSGITTHEYTDKIEEEGKEPVYRKWNAYRFKDTGISFSKDYVLPGEELKITFQSGKLNGMEFAVTFNPCDKEGGETPIPEKLEDGSWNPAAQVWEIIRNEDYGRELPGDVLIPKDGDTYVLSGWDSTKIAELGLVAAAELELKEKAEAHRDKAKVDPSTYTNRMMCDKDFMPLDAGARVNLINKAFFDTGSRQSRIIGFEYNLDIPYDYPVYTVGETASYSRIAELENKIESITLKGQTYTGEGGSGIYLIKSNDTTPASDSNTYSAKWIQKEFEKCLRKDKADIAQEIITFLKGILIGNNGSGITVLENGMSQAVVDYLYVKVKAVFDALEIKKKTYVGGEQVISHAGMKCNRVEELDDVYRCYFKAEEDGIEIEHLFTPGSLAIAQECNIKTGISHHIGNRYYWREVTAVGTDYIDLSKTVCDPATENDVPAAGDDIVALGHRTDITRQGAIVLSSVNEVSPSILMYQGIDDFTLTDREVIAFDYDKATGKAGMRVYGDAYIGTRDKSQYVEFKDGKVNIRGTVHIEPGSTGFENVSGMEFGTVNLLRNSGFTGDYETEELTPATELTPDSEMYSKSLEFWTGMAKAQEDAAAVSGRSAVLGSLSQSVSLINRELYVISYKAKGESLAVSCGDYSVSQPLTSEYGRYKHSFTFSGAGVFMLSGTATVCDVQLERGTLATDWKPSPLDNDKSMAEFQSIRYIADAIKNGSVDIIGGLILSSMIQLGNYKDGKMQKVTAGISGVYNDNDDVYTWAGGTFEQAIRTVMMFKNNPKYQPTEEELASIANAVITHGGRAILNDVILRGYVYALGGYFRGTIEQADGFNKMNEDGSVSFCGGKIRWDKNGNPIIEGKVTTSVNGTRIEIDPADNSIKMYNQDDLEVGKINFLEEEWSGTTNYYPKLTLTRYSGKNMVGRTNLTATSLTGYSLQNGNSYDYSLGVLGLVYLKNGVITKTYPNE